MIDVIECEEITGTPNTSQAWANLKLACMDFETSYNAYLNANPKVLRIDTDRVLRAARKANGKENLEESIQHFRTEVLKVIQSVEKKEKQSKTRWVRRTGNALSHLYPVARVCLGVAKLVGEVCFLMLKR